MDNRLAVDNLTLMEPGETTTFAKTIRNPCTPAPYILAVTRLSGLTAAGEAVVTLAGSPENNAVSASSCAGAAVVLRSRSLSSLRSWAFLPQDLGGILLIWIATAHLGENRLKEKLPLPTGFGKPWAPLPWLMRS
jgi:hypothetical protein